MTEAKKRLALPSYLSDESVAAISAALERGDEVRANAIASSTLARLSELDTQFVGELLQHQRNAVEVRDAHDSAAAPALHEVDLQA